MFDIYIIYLHFVGYNHDGDQPAVIVTNIIMLANRQTSCVRELNHAFLSVSVLRRDRQFIGQRTRLLAMIDKPLVEQEIIIQGSDNRYLYLFTGRACSRMKAVMLTAMTTSEPYYQVRIRNVLYLQFS